MDWIEQYAAALSARDAREQAHKPYLDAYTKLADRRAGAAGLEGSRDRQPNTGTGTPRPTPPDAGTESSALALTRLRTELATTQKARGALEARVEALGAAAATADAAAAAARTEAARLARQKAELERRLRDREEEVRGKGALAERAQDEMVALGLQLHMAERRAERLAGENGELVARWMRRVGEEAERVNRDSKWE